MGGCCAADDGTKGNLNTGNKPKKGQNKVTGADQYGSEMNDENSILHLLKPEAKKTLSELEPFEPEGFKKKSWGMKAVEFREERQGAYYSGFIDSSSEKRHGFGKYLSSDGSLHEGFFKDGVKEGPGRKIFANGEWLICTFENDRAVGEGEYHFADGSVYTGQFKDSAFHGHGQEVMGNGDMYIGTYSHNMRNGKFTHTKKDGSEFKGDFEDNEI